MRPARVRLIDLGFDPSFDTSMAFAQSLVQSLVVSTPDSLPVAEVEFIRTRDFWTVAAALQNPADIIHVLAHGSATPDEIGFWSEDGGSVSLTDLAERFGEDQQGIDAPVFFADCCSTAQGRFTRAVRDCIEQPTTYIGARRMVSWHESTTFASAFYGAYFRNRGKGMTGTERGMEAGRRAVAGYSEIVGGKCPFAVLELRPSRRAKGALGK